MIKKLAGEKKLRETIAAAEAEQAKTTETRAKIPIPKKLKNQNGPLHLMGDIVLKQMPKVDDAEHYYSLA